MAVQRGVIKASREVSKLSSPDYRMRARLREGTRAMLDKLN